MKFNNKTNIRVTMTSKEHTTLIDYLWDYLGVIDDSVPTPHPLDPAAYRDGLRELFDTLKNGADR